MSEDPEDKDANPSAPFEELREEIDARMSTDNSDTPAEPDANDRPPLDELADSVAARDSPEAAYDDLFEEAETADIDAETVWKQLEANEPLADASEVGGEQRIVPKADYCDSCPYLSDPPEMTCTHEGTEILELVDLDRVAVQNCPIVKENEELEEI
ncbi:MAG: hypothetical protein ACLFR6_00480 [Salinarchaeum sp.]